MKKKIITLTTTAVFSASCIANASASTYKVEKGDTLWAISKKHNTSIEDLKKWNNLSKEVIFPNQVLKLSSDNQIHSSPSKNEPSSTVIQNTYTVKPGDTLSKIAVIHSITLEQLMNWNNVSSHLIYPGQTLIVKSSNAGQSTETPRPQTSTPAVPSQEVTTYKVQRGDTLSHISFKFNISIADLKMLNKLNSDTIYVGQDLKIEITSNDVTPSTPGNPLKDSEVLLNEAKTHLGTPYVWGGSTPEGFDCSGFIYYVYKKAGRSISRYSSGGYYNRSYYVHTPQPGDLVFFENTYKKGISHLGIYIGDNQFIHAGDNGVEITSLDNAYWNSKFDGFKRLYDL
ncbi:C40 family peptidase [Bacillus sp. SG-1]|uniref:C40 family peptidase n=1 Tax=Bacillus sp. SG-1 TaxID=161544 RepID=UPI00015443D0|nr:LysM peptidoglycan-binding domain-containing protein [Bacillus sp. SG-1]EDL64894.1 peptidoglycan hydrolase [Bacillus sp. SG-1]